MKQTPADRSYTTLLVPAVQKLYVWCVVILDKKREEEKELKTSKKLAELKKREYEKQTMRISKSEKIQKNHAGGHSVCRQVRCVTAVLYSHLEVYGCFTFCSGKDKAGDFSNVAGV
jgi:hypothetical protein